MKNRAGLVLLVLAGLAWTSAQTLSPDMGLELPERLAAVADARERQVASAALLVVTGCLLVLAVISLVGRVPTGRGSRLSRAGLMLLGLGGIWLAAGRGAFSMEMLGATAPGVDREAALSVMSAGDSPAFIALLLCLPALLFGPVLLAVGVRRAGRAGWAPLACWVVGIGTFMATEFTNKVGETVGIAVASVGLALIGLALTRPAAEVHVAGWRELSTAPESA